MKSTRVYVVKAKILEWRPQADNALRRLRKQQLQPPVLPENFASLPPEAKQNFLLSNAMCLPVRLLDIAAHLDPQSAREIAQLAAVAQGIVRTSVELEQLRVDRNALDEEKRQEKIRYLLSKIPEREGPSLDESCIEHVKRPDGTESIRFPLTPRNGG